MIDPDADSSTSGSTVDEALPARVAESLRVAREAIQVAQEALNRAMQGLGPAQDQYIIRGAFPLSPPSDGSGTAQVEARGYESDVEGLPGSSESESAMDIDSSTDTIPPQDDQRQLSGQANRRRLNRELEWIFHRYRRDGIEIDRLQGESLRGYVTRCWHLHEHMRKLMEDARARENDAGRDGDLLWNTTSDTDEAASSANETDATE